MLDWRNGNLRSTGLSGLDSVFNAIVVVRVCVVHAATWTTKHRHSSSKFAVWTGAKGLGLSMDWERVLAVV